jgi:hypothetical protein
MHGQGWPRGVTRVGGGGGGPGRDGEVQLLNCIVVEALAGVCESEPEIECNMEFRIPLNWALMK